jgi:hypothetical protein
MKTLKSLLVAGSLLAALQLSATAQVVTGYANSRAEQWLSHYYQNPRPDDLPLAVHQLSREGYFERADQPATAIGFFATVFAQNPQDINYWLHETADLPGAHRRILAAAAWQAGSPRGAALLREMASNSSRIVQVQIADLLQRGPSPVAGTPVQSESSMNLQWGAFLASGDERPILAVLSALASTETNLSTAARYTLAQNAAEHRRVFDICRAQLDKQPESVRSELKAALNEASSMRQPGA